MAQPDYLISVLLPDRRGIIADVSGVIFSLGGNLEALSQTVMQGWFTMLIRACFPATVTLEQVESAVHAAGSFHVTVCDAAEAAQYRAMDGEPFILTAVGDDKPGIVNRLALSCAGRGVNIDDVWNEVREGRFITIFHLTLPRDVDAGDFRYQLEQAAGELGIAITLQHQDIFTATNSLRVHTRHAHPHGAERQGGTHAPQ